VRYAGDDLAEGVRVRTGSALLLGIAGNEARAIRLPETDAERAVLHLLRSMADDDVPVRAVLFQLRPGDRLEIHHDGLEHLALRAIALHDSVALVGRVPLDQHLSRDEAMAGFADREVNVRAAERALERVFDRLDGAEEVLAFGVRDEASVALEIGVVAT